MSKTADQIKPNYSPIYAAALYPELCKIFQKHGWALAVHGSLARDLDLVAVPWTPVVSEPAVVVDEVTTTFWIRRIGEFTLKEHGRICLTLSIGHGHCSIDLSFMPFVVRKKKDLCCSHRLSRSFRLAKLVRSYSNQGNIRD